MIDTRTVDAFILEKMIDSKLPGLSYVLVEGGTASYRSIGFRDMAKRLSPTPDTLFGLGSVTKVFTALAIMQLRDRGKLALEDPLEVHLDIDLHGHGKEVTVEHLLSHTSGLPALGYSESKMSNHWFMDGYPINSYADLRTFLVGADSWTAADPGKEWHYLNEGYILLGAIIERCSGLPYSDYIVQHILSPLGMERSSYSQEQVEEDSDRAIPYMRKDGELFAGANLYGAIPAAGGLVSTCRDMTLFAQMFLDDGRAGDGRSIISPEGLELMGRCGVPLPAEEIQVFSPTKRRPLRSSYYGLGLQIQTDFFGHEVIGHGGGVMGGTSYLAVIPKRRLAVVLLANAHGYPLSQLAFAVLASALGEDLETLSFVRYERLLGRLTGSYASFRQTMLADVTCRGGELILSIRFAHEDRSYLLIPEKMSRNRAKFWTYSGVRRLPVDFTFTSEGIELVIERYMFRKSN
jgi:CubicO group peptidase (beta-lactamase class C family)